MYSNKMFMIFPLFLVYVIETYLFLAATRLLLGLFPQIRDSRPYIALTLLTDPVPRTITRTINRNNRTSSSWLPWTIVIVAAVVSRHLIAWWVISQW